MRKGAVAMAYFNSLYLCYALLLCIVLVSFFGLCFFKYKTLKEIKSASILNNMSLLQRKYYGALKKNKFQKYPEIKKQIEKTLNIYSSSINKGDYSFKNILVVRKKNASYEGLIDSELFKELQSISKTAGILNEIMDLNSNIKEELLILKKPIRYRFDLIFQNMILHSLKFIICVSQNFEVKPNADYINKIYEYKSNKYDIANA
jgi:hypothetical protein